MSLTITQRSAGPVDILTLSGKLILGEPTAALRGAIGFAMTRGRDLLVDLSGVSYIDSSGLGELVAAFASVTSRGMEMKLLKPHPRVDSMLLITKLYTTFEVFDDEAAGLVALTAKK